MFVGIMNIKLNTKNSEKGKREKGKKKGFIVGVISRGHLCIGTWKKYRYCVPYCPVTPTGHRTFYF